MCMVLCVGPSGVRSAKITSCIRCRSYHPSSTTHPRHASRVNISIRRSCHSVGHDLCSRPCFLGNNQAQGVLPVLYSPEFRRGATRDSSTKTSSRKFQAQAYKHQESLPGILSKRLDSHNYSDLNYLAKRWLQNIQSRENCGSTQIPKALTCTSS